VQARGAGSFTAAHEPWWAAARAAHGDAGGTRVLVEVPLLHRHLPAAAVVAGLRAALAAGVTSPHVVAVQARRAATSAMDTSAADGVAGGPALTLPDRPVAPAVLTPEEQPLPSVQAHDELLSRRTPDASARLRASRSGKPLSRKEKQSHDKHPRRTGAGADQGAPGHRRGRRRRDRRGLPRAAPARHRRYLDTRSVAHGAKRCGHGR
jgi:hypothetical protein